ncbi:hypothetical protein Droror1_Dr00011619 [Drosera rotundifolia]
MERSMSASMILLLFLGLACMLSKSASAFIHVVGGSDGWEIPSNATFYQEWAKPRTFGVVDKLGNWFHSCCNMHYGVSYVRRHLITLFDARIYARHFGFSHKKTMKYAEMRM